MTSTKYVKAHVANKKTLGLKELRRLWAYPEAEQDIRDFAEKANKRALKRRAAKEQKA